MHIVEQLLVARRRSCWLVHRSPSRTLRLGQFEHSPSLAVESSALWTIYILIGMMMMMVLKVVWCELRTMPSKFCGIKLPDISWRVQETCSAAERGSLSAGSRERLRGIQG